MVLKKAFLLFFLLFSLSNALIHHLKVNQDHRGSFYIESFSFEAGGHFQLSVTNIRVDRGSPVPATHRIGFVVKQSEINNKRFISEHRDTCLLDLPIDNSFEKKIILDDWTETRSQFVVPYGGQGFYEIYFVNCDTIREGISFNAELSMYNIENGETINYLPAGETLLPSIYFLYSLIYALCFVFWVFTMYSQRDHVRKIHFLMALVILLKSLSLIFHSIELHSLNNTGLPGAWTWVYLFFHLLKGISFFTVVALIGSGWAFLKPFLNERDEKILISVVFLQIISNIGLAILEESSPGTSMWFTWSDILTVVDLGCCVAILTSIGNSLNNLQQASKMEDKGDDNCEKLRKFKDFYLSFICYVYFTRIISYLLKAGLSYQYTWFSSFSQEVFTLIFFILTGVCFQPYQETPKSRQENDEL